MQARHKFRATPRAAAGKDSLKFGHTFEDGGLIYKICDVGTRVRDHYPVKAVEIGDVWDNIDLDINSQEYRFEKEA